MSLLTYYTTGLVGHLFPKYKLVDKYNIKIIETEYGKFHYSEPLQNYPNLFDDVSTYQIDDINQDDVVLDIGACVGASTVMFARKCKKVYAVEPLFSEELKENIKLNDLSNVCIFPYALGSGGVVNFCGRERTVYGYSLSKLLKLCIEQPTFLKMDCEGGEWGIEPEELACFRAIEAEVHTFSGRKPTNFIKMLEKIGFSVQYSKTPEGQLMISARR